MYWSKSTCLKLMMFLFAIAWIPGCQASTPNPTVEDLRQLLFFEDFSGEIDNWKTSAGTSGLASYAGGVYRIFVDAPNTNIWATPGLDLGDVRIEVEVVKVAGDPNNRFGVLCRHTAGPSFYVFLISSDGYFGIGKINGSTYRLLGAQALMPSDQIPKGVQPLHIQAECIKDTLTLYVNGKQIHRVKDSELAQGDVGLIAGAYAQPGIEIFFDKFSVYLP